MTGQEIEQLRALAHVVRFGSFTAAAIELGVTQPAVSMQIRQFEARLGVRLIERMGRRAHPTAAALDLVAHLPRLEATMARAMEALEPHREGHSGRIRFGTGATACIYLLPPLLRCLRERMGGLDIVVRTANTADILRLVEENEIDIGLVTLPASGRRLEITPLLDDPLVAILPAERAAEGGIGAAISARELTAWPIALYEPGGETRRLIEDWFAASGLRPRPIMELGSIEAIKKLVGAGLCAAVIPALAVTAEAQDIVAVPLRPAASRMLGLVMRRDKRLDRGLREALQLLRELSGTDAALSRGSPNAFSPDRHEVDHSSNRL